MPEKPTELIKNVGPVLSNHELAIWISPVEVEMILKWKNWLKSTEVDLESILNQPQFLQSTFDSSNFNQLQSLLKSIWNQV